VRNPTVLLVIVLAHQAAVESSPELHRRAALPHRAVRRLRRVVAARATQDGFATSRASPRCFARTKSSPLTRSRASPSPAAAARRRPPPLAAGRVLARVLTRWIQIMRSRSNRRRCLSWPPPLAIRSRSNGLDRVSLGQYRSNRQTLAFLQKAPCTFWISQIYPPTVLDSFQLGQILRGLGELFFYGGVSTC
jgi:hypothetical protein